MRNSSLVAVIALMRVALFLISCSLFMPTSSFGAENLLLNGDLSAGSGDAPLHWTKTPFAPANSFAWTHSQGDPATLEVAIVPGHFRHPPFWRQTINLAQPGWYVLRTEVRTDNRDAFAVVKFANRIATLEAAQSDGQWTPMEVYLNAPTGSLQIGCGVRAIPAGRAFFRKLTFSLISGTPPHGSRQLDITNAIVMSRAEKNALLAVELAQSRPEDSLWRSFWDFRVIALVLFLLVSLTWLDARYNGGFVVRRGWRDFLYDPTIRKSAVVAALLCLMLLGTWLVTRIEFLPGRGFYVVEPHAVGGDEPHYLVMINSLLFQHDLHLQAAYDDVDQGGPEAGVLAHLTELDRHTVVVNQRTGHRAMANVRNGEWFRNPSPEFAPSPDVYEVPVHPAAFPILVALAIAPMRPAPGEVERDVGWVLMLIAWLGVVATYFVGLQVGMSRRWAMLAAATLFAASPWLAYSRAYFAETTIGTVLVLGLWAMLSDFPILAALAVVVGTAMKPPFAVVGAGFLAEQIRERRWKKALNVVLIISLCAIGWFFRDYWIHRRFLPFSQLFATLLDPVEGLLLYAPWTIFGFIACGHALLPHARVSRLIRTIALPILLYLVAVGSVGHGSGYCYGPRYWVAFIPWLALATVEAMRQAGRYQRALCALLVVGGIAIAIPGALRYPQLFSAPVLGAWRGFH